jgi:hypothetical protein
MFPRTVTLLLCETDCLGMILTQRKAGPKDGESLLPNNTQIQFGLKLTFQLLEPISSFLCLNHPKLGFCSLYPRI